MKIGAERAVTRFALLGYLTNWVANPCFPVRYRWTTGTIAIWGNCCAQRVTVMGDKLSGAAPPRSDPWVKPGPRTAASRLDRQLHKFLMG